ncbi:MAG: S-adenosylmethionine:tRNA ribosyltransferase-isomerase [Oscillospiraceae bacterium]
MLKTHDFYYDLPEELIAQTPLERRDGSRLMVLNKDTGEIEHRHFYDLPEYLQPGDTLVLNDSRVLPARLLGHRVPTMGAVEGAAAARQGRRRVGNASRSRDARHTGTELSFGDGELTATVVGEVDDGNASSCEFHYKGIFLEVLERLGQMPLPPYIHEQLQDPERLPDRLFKSERLCCCADGGASFYEGASGKSFKSRA